MKSLQEEPPCDVNVILTKELSSLPPSGITTDQSCFAPIINAMEEVDNFGKSNNIDEDKGSISEPKLNTHDANPKGHQQRLLDSRVTTHTRIGGSLHDPVT